MNKSSKTKKVLSILLVLIMVLALVACGNKAGDSGSSGSSGGSGASSLPANATIEDVIAQVQKNMEEVESMSYKMNMDIGMELLGTPIDTVTVADVEVISSPVALKMVGNMDMGDMGAMDMTIYAEESNGKLDTYTGMEMEGETYWMKDTVDMDSAQISQYNAKASLDLYLKNAKNFKEAGSDTINGSKCTRYDGVITGDDLNEVIESSGAGAQLEAYGDLGADVFKDAGDIPVSLWVDESELMVKKYDIDMTDVMKVVMEKAMSSEVAASEELEGLGDLGSLFAFTKMTVSCEVTGINSVTEIVIPDEVKEKAESL